MYVCECVCACVRACVGGCGVCVCVVCVCVCTVCTVCTVSTVCFMVWGLCTIGNETEEYHSSGLLRICCKRGVVLSPLSWRLKC